MRKRSTHHYFATRKAKKRAKVLRRNETLSEKKLWEKLRNGNMNGLKFRRQHAIRDYIADFYCHELRLVIEVDGEIHDREDVKMHDEKRTKRMMDLGVKVLRYKNEDVFFYADYIVHDILKLREEMRNSVTKQQ